MVRTAVVAISLGFGLAGGLAGAAQAAIMPIAPVPVPSSIITVGEGCGAGAWRAGDGVCRPFRTPYGSNRGSRFECPPGWHIGPGGARCWPNR